MTDFITLKGICAEKSDYKAKDGTKKYVIKFDIGCDDLVEVITDNDIYAKGQIWQLIITSTRFGLRVKAVCPVATN